MHSHFLCGKYQLNLNRPHVMGIVNVTPDSFSDGGQFSSANLAVEYALQLIAEGADILDVGGESTRPGAKPVSLDEELSRVIPVIKALSHIATVPISIDTYKPEVMRQAISAGADIVNDVRALQEQGALEAVVNSKVGVCLMHMQGIPQTMQLKPDYEDVVSEVKQFLIDRLNVVMAHGVSKNRILLDPGFGFGKTRIHNIALIQHLDSLLDMGQPLLVGLSRKSVLGAIAGGDEGQRLYASIAASVIAAMKGAKIIRVHDVKATVDALKVVAAIQ
ncbi:MAG: dihydropteroate synthase [Methylotenera sp.]|uniref:dihydropteroate synthase n=1 Tax=Methylotenera sp. TaxID=2051956 RepID=UPI00271C153A|nr:dihydropteroate synthase [Methylotenera sp.]MDO9205215.1 dihydropteroate synthase [Methylotenera sp.]MDO9394768.1 dihydropteroate synthase [Methylotenera sp.]MDP1522186.1 dihydropteroate synthase [Methylotenera sp.]MDP2230933.1 dihydropteroate synthase [Methylotenera sp.]MDP3140883.1 dihydropteroate synthase [Methylotenera sp.]